MNRLATIGSVVLAASAASGAAIGAAQRAAHRSPLDGLRGETEGVVTLFRSDGFQGRRV